MAQGLRSGESARLSPSPWDMPLQIAIYSILFFLFIKSAGIDSSLFRRFILLCYFVFSVHL